MNPKPISFQVRIRDLRKEQAMTQEMLAELLGVSRQSIIALENGKYMPSLPLALHIAQVFSLPLDEIFVLEEQLNQLIKQTENALVAYSSCPEVNIFKIGKALVLEANVVGYSKQDIEVEVEPYAVTIAAKVPAQKEEREYLICERRQSSFNRRVELPLAVNAERSQAEVQDGQLRITMPILGGGSKKLTVED